jgi:hypothetical protein
MVCTFLVFCEPLKDSLSRIGLECPFARTSRGPARYRKVSHWSGSHRAEFMFFIPPGGPTAGPRFGRSFKDPGSYHEMAP